MKHPDIGTKGRKYVQRYDGEPFEVKRWFIDRCCDCGLVHINQVTLKRRPDGRTKVFLTAWRDNRRTTNSRRSKRRFKR